jgi:hypothetical protein
MYTTLKQIRACSPCGLNPRKLPLTGYQLLVSRLGADFDPDAPVKISYILESNGLDDALWCLRAVKGYDRDIRLLAVDFARSVEHLTTEPRVKACNDVSERYAYGLATKAELDAARDAAWDSAWDAARAAARAAAGATAWDAAWDAARAAAGATAWDAAWAVQANMLAIVCAEIEQRV